MFADFDGNLCGRRRIYTTATEINQSNVIVELNKALKVHFLNAKEMNYLYWYRRGIQPILDRTKEVRPEICNKSVINNANQVVVFKNGYFLNSPAFYISRSGDPKITESVNKLNEYLYTSGKQQVDNDVVNWFHTVGVGVIFVKANGSKNSRKPAAVYSLDPRQSFVVYSRDVGNESMFCVNIVTGENGKILFDVITKDLVFRIISNITAVVSLTNTLDYCDYNLGSFGVSIEKVENNTLGLVPMVEYAFDENRMSSFESAIPIMDSINIVENNRLDGIEQFIQSMAVLVNAELPEDETGNSIREKGLLVLKSTSENKAEFKIISEQLDQTQTQVTLDDLYSQMLAKCGVPAMGQATGGTSDNVGAVYLRDGFAIADTHARNTRDLFIRSNKRFDEIFLKILRTNVGLKLDIEDFDLNFANGELTNLLVKTQGAINLKQLGLSPEIVLSRSGLSDDPVGDVSKSQQYIDAVWALNPDKKAQKEEVDVT